MPELIFEMANVRGKDFFLWLHSAADPQDAEWQEALARLAPVVRASGLENLRSLVISDGGAPTTRQRAALFRDIFQGKARNAVITPPLSTLSRGVATAIMWLNPQLRFFQAAQTDAALAHLGLKPGFEDFLPHFSQMEKKLKPNHTLAMIRVAMENSRRAQPAV